MSRERVRERLPAEERRAEGPGPGLFGCRGQLQVGSRSGPRLAVGVSRKFVCSVMDSRQSAELKPPLSLGWGHASSSAEGCPLHGSSPVGRLRTWSGWLGPQRSGIEARAVESVSLPGRPPERQRLGGVPGRVDLAMVRPGRQRRAARRGRSRALDPARSGEPGAGPPRTGTRPRADSPHAGSLAVA